MVLDMNFNEFKASPQESPQNRPYLQNGGLTHPRRSIAMENGGVDHHRRSVMLDDHGLYHESRIYASDNQTGTVFIRVSIPELKIQKCLQFELDETVWRAKQRILVTFAKDLKDSINYGLYCPPMNGKAGKFMDEERLLREYPLQGPIGFLEFKYKKRVYKMMHVNPRKLKQLHVKSNLRHFIDYVKSGNIEKVTKLTNKGLDPNFHDSSSGETPLSMAVSTGKSRCREMILCLAGGGAHLDYRNKRGITVLHKAVVVGNLEAVKTLLDLGVSPNLKDVHSLTALYFSVANNCNPLCTEMLLQERAFIGSVDDQGWAEIHHACQQGLVQHLEHLLFYGADLDVQNAAGNTPLHICALNNQESCLRVLLFRGANKEILNYSNQSAFEAALIAGYDFMAEIIDTHTQNDVVQYRDVPKYSTRRRDSVASMAMFAMYRSRSDPRINASYLDGNSFVSPSASTHSFSPMQTSLTNGSVSGSRGTDSPCSMSISSNGSGPDEVASCSVLQSEGCSSERFQTKHRPSIDAMSTGSYPNVSGSSFHHPVSQFEIIQQRLMPKSYHESLRCRLHGRNVYRTMQEFSYQDFTGGDFAHQIRQQAVESRGCRNSWTAPCTATNRYSVHGSCDHVCSHARVPQHVRHSVCIPYQDVCVENLYSLPKGQVNGGATCTDHTDGVLNTSSGQVGAGVMNSNTSPSSSIIEDCVEKDKLVIDIGKKSHSSNTAERNVLDKYDFGEDDESTISESRKAKHPSKTASLHSSIITKPPRTHRPHTTGISPAHPDANTYANTKAVHSQIQINANQLTTFQPIRSSASIGYQKFASEKYDKGKLELEVDHVYVCVKAYEATIPGHLQLHLGDIVEVLGIGEHGFWEGRANGNEGWFPSNHIQEIKLMRRAGSLGDIIKGTRDVNRNTLAAIRQPYR